MGIRQYRSGRETSEPSRAQKRDTALVRIRLLVVADTATKVADLRHETSLGTRLGCTRLRELIAHFADLPILLRGLVDLSSKCITLSVLYRSDVRAPD